MNQFHSSPSGMQCGGLARTKKLWDEISAAAADSAAAVQLAADEVMTEMRARLFRLLPCQTKIPDFLRVKYFIASYQLI